MTDSLEDLIEVPLNHQKISGLDPEKRSEFQSLLNQKISGLLESILNSPKSSWISQILSLLQDYEEIDMDILRHVSEYLRSQAHHRSFLNFDFEYELFRYHHNLCSKHKPIPSSLSELIGYPIFRTYHASISNFFQGFRHVQACTEQSESSPVRNTFDVEIMSSKQTDTPTQCEIIILNSSDTFLPFLPPDLELVTLWRNKLLDVLDPLKDSFLPPNKTIRDQLFPLDFNFYPLYGRQEAELEFPGNNSVYDLKLSWIQAWILELITQNSFETFHSLRRTLWPHSNWTQAYERIHLLNLARHFDPDSFFSKDFLPQDLFHMLIQSLLPEEPDPFTHHLLVGELYPLIFLKKSILEIDSNAYNIKRQMDQQTLNPFSKIAFKTTLSKKLPRRLTFTPYNHSFMREFCKAVLVPKETKKVIRQASSYMLRILRARSEILEEELLGEVSRCLGGKFDEVDCHPSLLGKSLDDLINKEFIGRSPEDHKVLVFFPW